MTRARTASPEPQHCAISHWLQSLQTVVASSGIIEPAATAQHVAAAVFAAAGTAGTGQLSARAPPASLWKFPISEF